MTYSKRPGASRTTLVPGAPSTGAPVGPAPTEGRTSATGLRPADAAPSSARNGTQPTNGAGNGDVLGDVNYLSEPDGTPPAGAPSVLSAGQVVGVALVMGGFVTGLVLAPFLTLAATNGGLVLFFMAANGMKLVLIDRSLHHATPNHLRSVPEWIADANLPVYTILLPVFREISVLRQLVAGIEALDYPKALLDVKLLLEEDDTETRDAVAQIGLPACFDILVVPDVGPQGKPRACNYGLFRAKGEYLVIFDAEDRPEPDQLRKSVAAFRMAARNVVCHQAKLNYFNRSHNLLTRWFTSEYSVWFDQLLPGLQSLDVAIPLGGTSNHFITERLRMLGGWNPYNVTEDAELGVRIYLRGWKTAVLDTTTYEEATSQYRNWIRQRSRWVKGYMQTYLSCMRRPVRLAERMGLKSFVSFQLFFGANTLCLLVNPIYWVMIAVWFATHAGWIPSIFPAPVFYLAAFGLLVGNGACMLSLVSGSVARRHYGDVKWAFLVPVYWVIMSMAAYKGLFQLFHKPSYWEKTEHGICQYEPSASIIPPFGSPPVRTESLWL
jgi:cellulose synthase/poly-beta-1,6-N-acetylglucosamine synthase-like glycosyltransferase